MEARLEAEAAECRRGGREKPHCAGVLKARARHFGWPAERQAGKTRERHDADGQRQGGKTICRSSACAHLFPIVFYSILLTCNDE